ncbi:hypothetical protein KOI40_10300 [Aestuariicella sp. G3-2]|uniref:SbcC/MukB-like Walker B domain-containing protein n=1 Tax=Pseudomaricurvus albidus TaxID=2842452 RepID=UPI001C0C6BAF|nr:SbcC/MukB-like Walker B domain-containing protein [Aestuariicella albida]MBU3070213.1 hypothetical protein [Aestuariicella albida]
MKTMHKLRRVTLINWYLFPEQDIEIDVDSLMFRGFNGAGKSSVLDAIQTVMAGGDENMLSLNPATSQDGKRSERTIRDYVLGEVNSAEGFKNYNPRSESNSYIALSFEDRRGREYAFGLSLYSRKSDPKVIKNYFIIKGASLSKLDFMMSDDVVLNWVGFEQRLASMKGVLYTPSNTASEFRRNYCDLISPTAVSSAEDTISDKVLFRALSNGLKFKETSDISEFARDQILPEVNIKTDRIKNDYDTYSRLAEDIRMAEERLGVLASINTALKSLIDAKTRAECYRWVEAEALFNQIDMQINNIDDRLESLSEQKQALEEQILAQRITVKELETKSDTALKALGASSSQQRIRELGTEKGEKDLKRQKAKQVIDTLRNTVSTLGTLRMPGNVVSDLAQRFNCTNEELEANTGPARQDLLGSWPSTAKDLAVAQRYLDQATSLQDGLAEEANRAGQDFNDIGQRLEDLKKTFETLEKGEASLRPVTMSAINLFAEAGINVAPICELVSISEPDWQEAIESFLSNNRESLVITSHNLANDDAAYEAAMRIYREAKRRRGKYLDTPPIDGTKVVKPSSAQFADDARPGTADELIVSDNPVAQGYLIKMLSGLKLVDTEQELRTERRAITKDCMVTANLAGGGIRKVSYKLFGADTRAQEAKRLHSEYMALAPEFNRLQSYSNQLSRINNEFSNNLQSLGDKLPSASKKLAIVDSLSSEIKSIDEQISHLQNSGDDGLAKASEDAKAAHKKADDKLTELETQLRDNNNERAQLNEKLPQLKTALQAHTEARTKIENGYFDREKASKQLEDLENEHGDDYQNIAAVARQRCESNTATIVSKTKDSSKLVQSYCERYEPEDRKELIEMEPRDALTRCEKEAIQIEDSEIVIYKSDAEQAKEEMLNGFRAEVANKLKDCFSNMETTFKNLNYTLEELRFNDNTYKFKSQVVESEGLKSVYDYIEALDGPESVGDLLDVNQDNDAIDIIKDMIVEDRLNEISDYRNFFSYELVQKNTITKVETNYSTVQSKGSGGEQNSPLYIVLGAAFMSAYKIRVAGSVPFGGAAFALFDEAFMRTDGNNTKAIMKFFKGIGLQVIIAGPPETEAKMGHEVERVMTIIRHGGSLHMDERRYKEAATALLDSDEPNINPDVVKPYLEEVEKEFGET